MTFPGYSKRALQVTHDSASRTESGFATERNIFEFTAIRTRIERTTVRWNTAVNNLADVFEYSRARMKFVEDMLIIINRNVLQYIITYVIILHPTHHDFGGRGAHFFYITFVFVQKED